MGDAEKQKLLSEIAKYTGLINSSRGHGRGWRGNGRAANKVLSRTIPEKKYSAPHNRQWVRESPNRSSAHNQVEPSINKPSVQQQTLGSRNRALVRRDDGSFEAIGPPQAPVARFSRGGMRARRHVQPRPPRAFVSGGHPVGWLLTTMVTSAALYRAGISKARSRAKRERRFQNMLLIRGTRYERGKNGRSLRRLENPSMPRLPRQGRRHSNRPAAAIRIGDAVYKRSSDGRTLFRVEESAQKSSCASKGTVQSVRDLIQKKTTRISVGGVTYMKSADGRSLKATNVATVRRMARQRLLESKRIRMSRAPKYCMFFNRYGHCQRQREGGCPYVHDSTKIAVCRNNLKGKCDQGDACRFSHDPPTDEKMPVCVYFMRGICSDETCPYLHVAVSPDAPVCDNFLKGYCSEGRHCKKRHVFECPEYLRLGHCELGDECLLAHVVRKKGEKASTEGPGRENSTEAAIVGGDAAPDQGGGSSKKPESSHVVKLSIKPSFITD